MAAADVAVQPNGPSFDGPVELVSSPSASNTRAFDPAIHLDFKPPAKKLTMDDLKLPPDQGIAQFAASEPFSLFTEEGKRVRAFQKSFRRELLTYIYLRAQPSTSFVASF
jgi:hypothetical protein